MFFKGIRNGLNPDLLVEALMGSTDISDQIVWELLNQTANNIAKHFDIIALALMIMVAISIIIGIAILSNQRKIKKQLRQLLEQKEVTSSDEKTTIGEDDEMQ